MTCGHVLICVSELFEAKRSLNRIVRIVPVVKRLHMGNSPIQYAEEDQESKNGGDEHDAAVRSRKTAGVSGLY